MRKADARTLVDAASVAPGSFPAAVAGAEPGACSLPSGDLLEQGSDPMDEEVWKGQPCCVSVALSALDDPDLTPIEEDSEVERPVALSALDDPDAAPMEEDSDVGGMDPWEELMDVDRASGFADGGGQDLSGVAVLAGAAACGDAVLRRSSEPVRAGGLRCAGATGEGGAGDGSHPWSRFTPEHVDLTKCLARIWNAGRGGQCDRRRMEGRQVCKMHSRYQNHGLVTGAIPPRKLREYQKASGKLEPKYEGCADGVAPKRRAAKHFWYSRAQFRHFARELDTPARRMEKGAVLNGIEQLDEHEFNSCLKLVHEHHLKRPVTKERLEKSKGVRSYADYLLDPEAADYNGVGGGEVFKWYTRPQFEIFLRNLVPAWRGPPRDVHVGVTERQCMEALRRTSDHLKDYHWECERLTPYAGPQCFPQLQDPERREANASRRLPVADAERDSGRSGLRSCGWDRWRRCDSCGRWRLLDAAAVGVFDTEVSCQERPGTVDWRAWLASAGERHDAFLEERRSWEEELPGAVRAEVERAGEGDGSEHGPLDEDNVLGRGKGPAVANRFVADPASEGAESELLQSDGTEYGVHSDEASRSQSWSGTDTESVGSREWAEALHAIGGRSGGLNDEELAEAEAMEKRGHGHRRAPPALVPVVGGVAKPANPVRVEFRCDMLLSMDVSASGTASWRRMSCEDADDFMEPMDRSQEARFQFSRGDEVWVLGRDASESHPLEGDGYLRPAVVLRVELADVDPRLQELAAGDASDLRGMLDVLPSQKERDEFFENRISARTRAGRKKKLARSERSRRLPHVNKRDMVILRFPAWERGGKSFREVSEVHYEADSAVDRKSVV